VTGGAGFLGSHLVDALMARGDEVRCLDNLHRGSELNLAAHLDRPRFELWRGDIRDYDTALRACDGMEVVFHLAAQSNVMGALSDPDYSFTSNVAGTYNVLKAASAAGVRKLVFSSSREVYGEPVSLPVREDAAPAPKNPYGASKAAGEAYCAAWQKTQGLDCQILRFGNLYGPRDSDRVIPLWVGNALRGDDLLLYGGHQTLDFFWVQDAVEALLAAAAGASSGPINVASGRGTRLDALAERVLEATESRSRLVRLAARDAEVGSFVADVSRMTACLGVEPPEDPLEHLEEMVVEVGKRGNLTP
jgi:UDP-glucose 4-epimerase